MLLQGDEDYANPDDKDDFIDDGDSESDGGNPTKQPMYRTSRHAFPVEPRRSSRTATLNSRKRPAVDNPLLDPETGLVWHGERRSTRLGNAPKVAFDEEDRALLPPDAKRARSSIPSDTPEPSSSKPSPVLITAPVGKKRSKYWYYTVEVTDGEPPVQGGESESKVTGFATANEPPTVTEDRSSSLSALSTPSGTLTEHEVGKGINGTNGNKTQFNGKANRMDATPPRRREAPPIAAAAPIKEESITGHGDAKNTLVFNNSLPESGEPTSRDPDEGSDMSFSDDE